MTTSDGRSSPPVRDQKQSFLRRNWGKLTLLLLLLIPAASLATCAGVTLNYAYSSGTRVGFVQKFSRKRWLCKTWEGELAMVNMPGAMSQIFTFSVRSDFVAAAINEAMAKGKLELQYDEHRGVPTSCFGETPYFVKGVKTLPG